MKDESAVPRFLLGLVLSCGLMAGLLYPCLPFGGGHADANFLSKAYEKAAAGDVMDKTQFIWGWVLLAWIVICAIDLLTCPVKEITSKKGKQAAARLFFPALLGTVVLVGVMIVLCSPALLAGFVEFFKSNTFLSFAGLVILLLLMYLAGTRSVPQFRSVEGLGNNFPKGLRIAEGVLVALFAGAALYYGIPTMRLYMLPCAVMLGLLPGTLCEWSLAKRHSGHRLGYLFLRTLRGIGLIAFCPVTVPVLIYALFAPSTSFRA